MEEVQIQIATTETVISLDTDPWSQKHKTVSACTTWVTNQWLFQTPSHHECQKFTPLTKFDLLFQD